MKSEQQKLNEKSAITNQTTGDTGTNLLLTSQKSMQEGGDIWNNAFSPVPQRNMNQFPVNSAAPAQPSFGGAPAM